MFRFGRSSEEQISKERNSLIFRLVGILCGTVFAESIYNCYMWFKAHDILLSTFVSIFVVIWLYYLLNHKKSKKKTLKDVVFFDPPKDFTAAEIAVIDAWGPTNRVFPAMLYDWVAKKFVRMGRTESGEICFEKITNSPVFLSDTKYLNARHAAYNKDPEHDFWDICFSGRSYVTMKMISNIQSIERIPHDFFYQVQRQCLDRNLYKKGSRSILNISWEIALLIPVAVGCFFAGFALELFLLIILGIAFLIRILSLHLDKKRGSKYYYLTDYGIKVLEHIQGFRKYLLAVDDDKLKYLLKDDPSYFEKNLPYAIAMGIGDGWLNKCFNHLQYDEFGGLISDGKDKYFSSDRITSLDLKKLIVDSISLLPNISDSHALTGLKKSRYLDK